MMMELTIKKLQELKLYTMAEKAQALSSSNSVTQLTPIEMLSFCVDAEYDRRKTARITALLRRAQIKLNQATVEDIDFKTKRNLSKDELHDVLTGELFESSNNILISGPTGVGKSYLACALANLSCRKGLATQYFRISRLLETAGPQKALGNYLKIIQKIGKIKLLVLDDLGPDIMTAEQRNFFLELIEERYLVTPTIVTSQLPFEQWYDIFGDPTVADAICDRLFHNARKITLMGESMRKRPST